MPIATLTSKGQLTMPQLVRETLGLEAGDKVDFVAGRTSAQGRQDAARAIRGTRVAPRGHPGHERRHRDRSLAASTRQESPAAYPKSEMIGLDGNVLVRYLAQDDPVLVLVLARLA
jgi:AbrB family looped-hinge helix DNA binding protein